MNEWRSFFSLSGDVPDFFVVLLVFVVLNGILFPVFYFLFSYFERKVAADFQTRIGPQRVGPAGFFQGLADVSKLLIKDRASFPAESRIWHLVGFMAIYSSVAILPLGSSLVLMDTEMSIALPLWIGMMAAVARLLTGLGQGTVPSVFGGIRVCVQAVSALIPAMISLIIVGLSSGGFKWEMICTHQTGSILNWMVFHSPFVFLSFFVFLMSIFGMFAVAPWNDSSVMGEQTDGVLADLAGPALFISKIARAYAFFFCVLIIVVIFLGGWDLPAEAGDFLRANGLTGLIHPLEMLSLFCKAMILMMGMVWIRRINPRIRYDQMTNLYMKVLSPLSILCLIGFACVELLREVW